MPFSPVDITSQPFQAWDEVAQALADCIVVGSRQSTTGAKVYPNWIYEIDPETLLGKVTAGMKATDGTDVGRVHCWCLGISGARFELNESGDVPTVGGQGSMWTWILTIDIWGFFEYDGTAVDQKRAVDEVRTVAAMLYRNGPEIIQSFAAVRRVSPLVFQPQSIQPTPMSGGQLVTVAAGSLEVDVAEALGM